MNNILFGEWLKEKRRSRDLTQDNLAHAIGCSLDMVQKIETGKRRASRQMAEIVVAFFGVPESERPALIRLARGESEPEPSSQSTKREAHRSNLPAQLTKLAGREKEIGFAVERLVEGGVRLLTLVGPPGIGKTRLAIRVAEITDSQFRDGAIFVELASVTDVGLVPTTIAEALGLKGGAEKPLLEALVGFLAGKQLLLVLDNFEQVIAAASFVAQLLARCPEVAILVTSREVLSVHGEQQMVVLPLDFPKPDGLQDDAVDSALEYPAVAVFVASAHAASPEFALTEGNVRAVCAICEQLEGLPLSIELAAARVQLFAPEVILTKLARRLGLLSTKARDVPARHQTLREAIDWSYELLEPSERILFRRLGAFVHGCTVTSVEVVSNLNGDLDLDVLDGLTSLLEKSLLTRSIMPNGEPRFFMLETIREYAKETLSKIGEAAIVQRLHAEYYMALAEATDPQASGVDQQLMVDLLEMEIDNLRAALGWAITQNEPAVTVRLASALWYFWYRKRHFSEGRRWLEAAISLGEPVQSALPGRAWGKTLIGAGVLAYFQGEYQHARERLDQALLVCRELGDILGMSSAYNNLGNLFRDLGEYDRAEQSFIECLALARQLEIDWRIATALSNLGLVMYSKGEPNRALELYNESLVIRRKLGDKSDIAFSYICLAEVTLHLQKVEEAASLNRQSLALSEELGDKRGVALSLHGLGMALLAGGDVEGAAEHMKRSLTLRLELGESRLLVENLEGLAAVASVKGDHVRAARLIGSTKSIRARLGLRRSPVDSNMSGRTTDAALAALGGTALTDALIDGEMLTLEDACTYAL